MLLLAKAAVSAIQQGVALLHEGRMELEGAKKTVDQVIGDVKAIKGIFQWFIGLFKPNQPKPAADSSPKPVAQKKTKAAEQQSYEQMELLLIKDIGEKLGLLFDTQQQITNYYLELEEESKTNYDPTQNTSKKAVERVLIELEMEKMMQSVREAMVYSPAVLKDMYSRFLKMYAKIEKEQEWARSETIRKLRIERWKQERAEIRCIELTSGVVAIVFIFSIFGWLMWQLRNLSDGF